MNAGCHGHLEGFVRLLRAVTKRRPLSGLVTRVLGVVTVSVTALAPACSRTPPEPAPAARASAPTERTSPTTNAATAAAASAQTATGNAAGRCLQPLAAAAPPVPAAASPPACPTDPEPNLKMPLAQVSFPDTEGSPRIEVEIAKTEHDVQRGLMYRQSMPDMRGMFFKLDERRDHTFWMHNTCIPLDMMFIDDDGVIVGIVESARPLDDTSRSVGCPSSYVLEVNAGWSRRHGVRPGQRVGIPAAAR